MQKHHASSPPTISAFGSWKSPITSDLITSSTTDLTEVLLDHSKSTGKNPYQLYWIETRPNDGGRSVLVQLHSDGSGQDLTPAPFNVRNSVHEYGGAPALIVDGIVYFTNFDDQRIYCHIPGENPRALTPNLPLRFADGDVDSFRERGIFVMEDHRDTESEAENSIVAVEFTGGYPEKIAHGADFYSNPRVSPDGKKLTWLSWNHPQMPWDGCELWVGEFDHNGSLTHKTLVAGGIKESIFQPEWSPDNILYFVSDRTGWWNLYCVKKGRVEPVLEIEAEFGAPAWQFGMGTYTFETARRIVCTYNQTGKWNIATLDTNSRKLRKLDTGFTNFGSLNAADGLVWTVAGSVSQPPAIVEINLDSGESNVLIHSSSISIDPKFISSPKAIEFPTENEQKAHAFIYLPKNDNYKAPEGELPPLIVHSHGGPTSESNPSFSLNTQYWTSRGFAVVDVNYGGSSGFGREYRERLKGAWGIVDVDDCSNAALYLANRGIIDHQRIAISGRSAGGYTTLCALTFKDIFSAGASHFGVSDCEALAVHTHKFESRYLDSLIGPYPASLELYRKRSAIHHVEQLTCPVAFFQGLEDRVVPPEQALSMVDALKDKGLPVMYMAFEGEQHGFRQAKNIRRALDGELYFYSRIFEFELAGEIEPIPIDNL